MRWKEAKFKGKTVWMSVDENDNPIVQSGLIPIRYSKDDGAKIYNASAKSIQPEAKPTISLDAGTIIPKDEKTKAKKQVSAGLGSAKTRTKAQQEKAKKMAETLVASFPDDAIYCFTDGACQGNPGPAGCGVFMQLPDGNTIERSVFLGQATNNIAELSAILEVLKIVEVENIADEIPVEICTDSKYVHGLLEMGWKAKSNQQLVRDIKQRIRNRGNITVHWVAGHAGIPQNERADELAVAALEQVPKQ